VGDNTEGQALFDSSKGEPGALRADPNGAGHFTVPSGDYKLIAWGDGSRGGTTWMDRLLGIEAASAFLADAMRELDMRVVANVSLPLLPTTALVANLPAPGAHGQEAADNTDHLPDFFRCFPPAFLGGHATQAAVGKRRYRSQA
jgi:hypothetical protein